MKTGIGQLKYCNLTLFHVQFHVQFQFRAAGICFRYRNVNYRCHFLLRAV